MAPAPNTIRANATTFLRGRRMTMGEGLVLRLDRTLYASRPTVYRALTEPAELGKWWGPRGFTAPCVEFDPKVGGGYRIAMQPPNGDRFHLFGEFRDVEPPIRLAYTFRWDPPHPDDRETVVTLSLEDRDGRTEVGLCQGEFATEERRALHEAGWTESFERLERLLDSCGMLPARVELSASWTVQANLRGKTRRTTAPRRAP